MDIIFATNNQGKVSEVKNILKGFGINVFSLKDKGLDIEVEEDGKTFEENALKKAFEVYKITKTPTISDDSGLEVYALKMRPSIYSARYAGENSTKEEKCLKILNELGSSDDRRARFVSVIAYIDENGASHTFRGEVYGEITHSMKGENGFGYDPIFLYPETNLTFGEMSAEEKDKISHRAKALEKFEEFFK